jgi:ketosteroid isomerase-like protein
MVHPHEKLARRAYEAQSRGDIETYLDMLTDDFVLHIPGRSRIAGDYRGRGDMRRHFREIGELSGGLSKLWLHPSYQYAFDEYWGERS